MQGSPKLTCPAVCFSRLRQVGFGSLATRVSVPLPGFVCSHEHDIFHLPACQHHDTPSNHTQVPFKHSSYVFQLAPISIHVLIYPADLIQAKITMSYAAAASKGPKQSAEEVCRSTCCTSYLSTRPRAVQCYNLAVKTFAALQTS